MLHSAAGVETLLNQLQVIPMLPRALKYRLKVPSDDSRSKYETLQARGSLSNIIVQYLVSGFLAAYGLGSLFVPRMTTRARTNSPEVTDFEI